MLNKKYVCPICGEPHNYFIGHLTQAEPVEYFEAKNNPSPNELIRITASNDIYIKGLIVLPIPDINEEYYFDNWICLPEKDFRKFIEESKAFEGEILNSYPMFSINAGLRIVVGHDSENDVFYFFIADEKSEIYDWQVNGLSEDKIISIFANAFHENNSNKNDVERTTTNLYEAIKHLKTEQSNRFVHARLNGDVIFQLIDSKGLELINSKENGIAIDIPIDTRVGNMDDELKILRFSKLNKFETDLLNGIRLYQFDYGDDLELLELDINLILKECFDSDMKDIVFHLEEMKSLMN